MRKCNGVFVHNILVVGPPGAGKTLLARSMPSILSRLTLDEALDMTRIYSVADLLPPGTPLVRRQPFRAPHRTISHAGLVGGGRWQRPAPALQLLFTTFEGVKSHFLKARR